MQTCTDRESHPAQPARGILAVHTGQEGNRPSLILRRAGEDGLWSLAKDTGSTLDAIRRANNLQNDPDPNQILLIPVP